MPLPAHRFPLNLADPCTRGWGGAYLNPSHASYWVIVTALLLPSMYDATIGPFLTPWVGLWCRCGVLMACSFTCAVSPISTRATRHARVSSATRAASPCTTPLAVSATNSAGRRLPTCAISAGCSTVCYWSHGRANPSATAAAIWITPITTTLSPRRSVTCAVVRCCSNPSSRRPTLITAGTNGATATLFTV